MGTIDIYKDWRKPEKHNDAFGPEASTWAKLSINLNGHCVTTNRPFDWRSDQDEDAVIGGMSGLAEWLVDNWKYILWETYCPFPKPADSAGIQGHTRVPGLRDILQRWQQFELDTSPGEMAAWQHRHTFGHASSDIALPSIVFMPESRSIGIAVDQPPTRYKPTILFSEKILPEGQGQPVWISRDDFEETFSGFIKSTIVRAGQAADEKPWAEWLEKRFSDAQQEAVNSRVRLNLMFGEFIEQRWNDIDAELGELSPAFNGVLQDSRRIEKQDVLDVLKKELTEAAKNGKGKGEWTNVGRDESNHLLPPYEQGYLLAERVRSFLGKPDAPFPELGEVLKCLDVAIMPNNTPTLFRSTVVTAQSLGATILYAAEHPVYRTVAASRFAIAASLGRLLAEGGNENEHSFGAAHGSHSRWLESQRANAFAAEFLLPAKALERTTDPATLSEEYGISRIAAEWQVSNRRPGA